MNTKLGRKNKPKNEKASEAIECPDCAKTMCSQCELENAQPSQADFQDSVTPDDRENEISPDQTQSEINDPEYSPDKDDRENEISRDETQSEINDPEYSTDKDFIELEGDF